MKIHVIEERTWFIRIALSGEVTAHESMALEDGLADLLHQTNKHAIAPSGVSLMTSLGISILSVNVAEAVAVLLEKYENCGNLMHGFD